MLSEPKLMPEGTVLRCLVRYDNSADNPSNPDPKHLVTWGEQTRDEMLVGYVEVALAQQDLAVGEPEAHQRDDGRYDVTFRYRPPAGTHSVYLAGTFNDWKTDGLKMEGPDKEGRFEAKLTLDAGSHEYKYVLDGTRWRHDPGNRRQAGYYNNSVLVLGKQR